MSLTLTAFFIAAGLAMLAFAMRRHYVRVTGWPIDRRERMLLRSTGWTLLAAALAAAVTREGAAFGMLLWIALLGVSGCALVLLLAYRPRLLFRASGAAALSALAAASRGKS